MFYQYCEIHINIVHILFQIKKIVKASSRVVCEADANFYIRQFIWHVQHTKSFFNFFPHLLSCSVLVHFGYIWHVNQKFGPITCIKYGVIFIFFSSNYCLFTLCNFMQQLYDCVLIKPARGIFVSRLFSLKVSRLSIWVNQ